MQSCGDKKIQVSDINNTDYLPYAEKMVAILGAEPPVEGCGTILLPTVGGGGVGREKKGPT